MKKTILLLVVGVFLFASFVNAACSGTLDCSSLGNLGECEQGEYLCSWNGLCEGDPCNGLSEGECGDYSSYCSWDGSECTVDVYCEDDPFLSESEDTCYGNVQNCGFSGGCEDSSYVCSDFDQTACETHSALGCTWADECTDDDQDNYYVESFGCDGEPGFLGHNDCDDTNMHKWRTVANLATDNDLDGYVVESTPQSFCVGTDFISSGRQYYNGSNIKKKKRSSHI